MSDEKRTAPHLAKYQFKPGQTGNAGGRPKGYERRLRECVESMTADDPTIDPEIGMDPATGKLRRIPAFEAIVKQAVLDAIAGDRYARDFIADRIMGKVKQTVALVDDSDPQTEANWAAVPVEKRRELFETLALIAPGDGADATEH